MKRPTIIQQQESFTVAESTCPMQPNMGLPVWAAKELEPVFEILRHTEGHWHKLKGNVSPPVEIDMLPGRRHDIQVYETSKCF